MDSSAFGSCIVIGNKLSKRLQLQLRVNKKKNEQLKVVPTTMTLFKNYLKFC